MFSRLAPAGRTLVLAARPLQPQGLRGVRLLRRNFSSEPPKVDPLKDAKDPLKEAQDPLKEAKDPLTKAQQKLAEAQQKFQERISRDPVEASRMTLAEKKQQMQERWQSSVDAHQAKLNNTRDYFDKLEQKYAGSSAARWADRAAKNSPGSLMDVWRQESTRWDAFFESHRGKFRGVLVVVASLLALDWWLGEDVVQATEPWEDQVPLQHMTWSHDSWGKILDKNALRRGFEVYRQVCATCHSLELINFRNLVGVTHTEEQAKNLAASYTVVDGPNDHGEMFERPGRLSDPLPKPYPNKEFARYANGGAMPPDMSLLTKARFNGLDHVYSILTGYVEPEDIPAGIELREGLYFNKYFAGSAIAMPPPLQDGQVDYEDGTPATVSQMSKDVTEFLYWAAEPNFDERTRLKTQWLGYLAGVFLAVGFWKRFRWNPIKSRRITYPDSKKW